MLGIKRNTICFVAPSNPSLPPTTRFQALPRWLREKPYYVAVTLRLFALPSHPDFHIRQNAQVYNKESSREMTTKNDCSLHKNPRKYARKRWREPKVAKPRKNIDKTGLTLRVGSFYQLYCHGAHSPVQVSSFKRLTKKSIGLGNALYRIFLRPESFIQLSSDSYFCKIALMDHNLVRGVGRIIGVYFEESVKIQACN